MAKFHKMAKRVFFVARALQKWPNVSKLAIKWPIWQPWSCISASKPLNEQEVIATAITTALVILHLHASDVHQHSTFNRGRAATLL